MDTILLRRDCLIRFSFVPSQLVLAGSTANLGDFQTLGKRVIPQAGEACPVAGYVTSRLCLCHQ